MNPSISKRIIRVIIIALIIRLFFLFFNHFFDFFNILVLVKSVADTDNVIAGYQVLQRINLTVQLYGKMYYQISALWIRLLDFLNIIDSNTIFDTKPYQNIDTYMSLFMHAGPELWKLIVIKGIQFAYDIVFLFFLIKTVFFVKKNAENVFLFWAINPFLIFVTYSMFQADIAMLAFLMAGVYFWMKSLQAETYKLINIYSLSSLFFLTVGGVIKQFPLLLIPYAILSFSKNWISFIIYSVFFAITYSLFSQPWHSDTAFMRYALLRSKESLALFEFSLNGVSVFLFFYLLFFIFVLFMWSKKKNMANPFNLISIIVGILSILYVSRESSFLFFQLNTWIMPFIALLSLKNKHYSIFLIAPVIGYIKRTMVDNDVFAGSLGVSLGSALGDMPKYKDFIRPILDPVLFDYFFTSLMAVIYVILLICLILDLLEIDYWSYITSQNSRFWTRINLKNVTKGIFIFYIVFFIGDYFLKSNYVLLNSGSYQQTNKEISLLGSPATIIIDNPEKRVITGITMALKRKSLASTDSVVFQFTDLATSKHIFTQKMSDYTVTENNDPYYLFFKRPISSSKIELKIYKEKGSSDLYLSGARYVSDDVVDGGHLAGYRSNLDNSNIKLTFLSDAFDIKLRGRYPLHNAANRFFEHIKQQISFFVVLFSIIGITILYVLIRTINPTIKDLHKKIKI